MAFSKTFVVRTQSGKTMSFDDYRRQLAKLSTSEGLRMRELRSLLWKESKPTVTAARRKAYAGASRKATVKQGQSEAMNLYNSIQRFKNKRNPDKAYVVIGLVEPDKNGAIYGRAQLLGGGPGSPSQSPRPVGVGRKISKQTQRNKPYKRDGVMVEPKYIIKAKNFLFKAAQDTNVMMRAQALMQRHMEKRLKVLLG
jgi:hypothetical protein